ncbi:thiolase family protein [Leucobacter massiliensis]|uniref:Acetyl-CoA acetyltransferase n=1 Tax=Leucobacter massiliensis TaxID=1686285 RepID=A0A2S9QRZ1_9MICO|nr:thiolase family protein [Leucobacter massiliensis]PRI12356.1 acetyl-CoA acetyltransferase [Leucobacter massiliensis]
MPTAVIVDAVRSAFGRGKPGGALSGVHPVDLAAHVLRSLLERNALDSAQVDDVIMGTFGQVGEQSWNVGRHALLSAGFAETVPATTVDRQCGSSQQAAHFAAQGVIAGAYDIVIAAGVESMSRVPLGTSDAAGDPHSPGIRARYPEGLVHQGISAELIAAKWGFSRDTLDAFAAESHRRAAAAGAEGRFAGTIVPIEVTGADGGARLHSSDETVRPGTTVEALAGLKPAYYSEAMAARFPQIAWNITAGNASPLTDGASALLIMSEEKAGELGLTPRARFHAFAVVGDDPLFMLTGPIPATRKILQRTGLTIEDMDAYEVNEAFASVPLAWATEVGADPAKLNPWGGAIAIGHPLGASGARLMGNLLAYLEATGGRYGLQAVCEGGGMANATIIERL